MKERSGVFPKMQTRSYGSKKQVSKHTSVRFITRCSGELSVTTLSIAATHCGFSKSTSVCRKLDNVPSIFEHTSGA